MYSCRTIACAAHPPAPTGSSIVVTHDAEPATLDGVAIRWSGGVGGAPKGKLASSDTHLAFSKDGKTEEADFSIMSGFEPEGEYAVFGMSFVVHATDATHATVTHTGTAREHMPPECDAQKAATIARNKIVDDRGMTAWLEDRGIGAQVVGEWSFHCGKQTGRFWVSPRFSP